jgi:hypothetical protein
MLTVSSEKVGKVMIAKRTTSSWEYEAAKTKVTVNIN